MLLRVLIPQNLLVELVGLELKDDLDNCSLHNIASVQGLVGFVRELLLPQLDHTDRVNLAFNLGVFKDNVTVHQLEVDLVQHLDRNCLRPECAVKRLHVVLRNVVKLTKLECVRQLVLDQYFVLGGKLDKDDVDQIDADQDKGLRFID